MEKVLYSVTGSVVAGGGYGKALGFPTANLDRREYIRRKMHIREGIYAGTACVVKGQELKVKSYLYRTAIVIGPKDKKDLPKIEAYLLDFHGVLYGKRLTISFFRYLRPFMSFRTEAELKRQIAKDIVQVKKLVRLSKTASGSK